MPDAPTATQPFIAWKPEYDSLVQLINCQHRGILHFVNSWHADLKFSRIKQADILDYLHHRFGFLDHYTKSHLAFEEDMLLLLNRNYGFPDEEYCRHLAAHRNFTTCFMATLSGQIDLFAHSHVMQVVDTILVDVLRDVAAWWFNHIRTSDKGKPAGPDYTYRMFMQTLPQQRQFQLLNDLLGMATLNA
jgi:hypothetical protein